MATYWALTYTDGSFPVDETQIYGGGKYGAYTYLNGKYVDIARADPIGDWHALLQKGFQSGGWQVPSLIDALSSRAAQAGYPGFDWGPAIATLIQSNAATYGRPDVWTDGSPAPSIEDDILAAADGHGLGPGGASGPQLRVSPTEKAAAIKSMQDFQASQGESDNTLLYIAAAAGAAIAGPEIFAALSAEGAGASAAFVGDIPLAADVGTSTFIDAAAANVAVESSPAVTVDASSATDFVGDLPPEDFAMPPGTPAELPPVKEISNLKTLVDNGQSAAKLTSQLYKVGAGLFQYVASPNASTGQTVYTPQRVATLAPNGNLLYGAQATSLSPTLLLGVAGALLALLH